MLKAIVSIFNQSKGQYGVRRVYHELIHLSGYKGNHEQVYHLMRMANLMGKRPGEKGKPKSYRGCVEKVE
ncbi:transposase [Allisonella histaminiformans]|uniref:transposase n=1 Tax=Allisonella histaminiformans TaxID=209880 RepID=UPI0024095A5A|nr:transposase [Allisonella histaminiformans]MDD6871202.1 transposase [Allisonella histaminiformans]